MIGAEGGGGLKRVIAAVLGMIPLFLLPVSSASGNPPLVIIFMENHSSSAVLGNPNAPYMNSLLALGRYFSNYREGDATGPSLPDYLEVVGGSRCGSADDAATAGKFGVAQGCPTTLWNQLQASGLSWGVYQELMPSSCYGSATYQAPDDQYSLKHNPATVFASVWSDQTACKAHVLPLTSLDPTNLPEVSFVTPSTCNDMHGSTAAWAPPDCVPGSQAIIARGDAWLGAHVPDLLDNGAEVFITFDESGTLYAVDVGPGVPASVTDATPYTHYSVLAAIEGLYGFPLLGAAATATPLPIAPRPVAPAPTITGFDPAGGGPGESVTINGTALIGTTSVTFDGLPAAFSVTGDTSVVATVPPCATSGPIGVTTRGGAATSGSDFMFVSSSPLPGLCGFDPSSGGLGDPVTITGTDLAGASSVTFNGMPAAFTVTSDTSIATSVPPGATTGPISVATPGGTATSSSSFIVTASSPPAISSFTPTSGPVGTSVAITGTAFTGTTGVKFNGKASSFTVTSDTSIATSVPPGATTGPISVTTSGGTATSASSFAVTRPTISDFSPTSGPVGTAVTITGTNLTGATTVTFNGITAKFTVNSDTQITATVPSRATTGLIKVKNAGGAAASASAFTVTASPVPAISGLTPSAGPVGTVVTITGSGFIGTTAVRFNGTAAKFTVNSDTQITATAPTGATTGPIGVTTPGGMASTPAFTITSPIISGFTPTSGPVGTAVTITGTNFTGATRVTFNGTVARFTVDSDTQITATVPAGATTGTIRVRNAVGPGVSSTNFTVT